MAEEPSVTVYQTINPDGSISFSDEPKRGSTSYEVKPLPLVPAYKPLPNQQVITSTKPAARVPGYTSFKFDSPVNHSAFHSGSGSVEVRLSILPELHSEHSIQFLMDGKQIAQHSNLSIVLNNIDRGTHQLEAHVIDSTNKRLSSTYTTFTVHRPVQRR